MALLFRLRRITRDGRWIPEIDGLRFLAIAGVFLFHLIGEVAMRSGRVIPVEARYWWLNRLVGNGDRGVRLFFVISGMILALPFARHLLADGKPVSIGKYYMRRVTRLEPPYILALCVGAFGEAILWGGLPSGSVLHFLASIFYLHGQIYADLSPFDPVTWSLEVEIQFYLLAPLLMQLFRVRGVVLRRCLILSVSIAIGLAQLPFFETPRVYMSVLFYLQYFLAGLLVADVFVLDLDTMKSSWGWDVAGISAFAVAALTGPWHWMHVILPFAFALLIVSAMRSYLLRKFFSSGLVPILGGMCYSIYLLHLLLIAAVFKVSRHAIVLHADFLVNYLIQIVVTGVPVISLCCIYYLLVERPCMDPDWPSKLWRLLTGRVGDEVASLDTAGVSD